MADSTSQANRLLSLQTPLQADGEDVLLISSFTASEIISRMFSVELQMIVDNHKAGFVDAGKVVGEAVTLSMTLYDEGHATREFMTKRYFNGIVSRFIEGDKDDRYHYYQANVVPWLWLMTSRSDCRIFQDLDVPAIITKVFDDLRTDYPDLVFYRNDLRSEYTKRDYCVQYRETDFNFVSRLMEEEGIFYYFEHHEDKHILVLGDATDCHSPIPVSNPGDPKVRYYTAGMGEWEDIIVSWQKEQSLRPGKYVLRDYHFQMPKKTLLAEAPTKLPGDQSAGLEVYDYPGGYAKIFNKPDQRLGDVETQGQRVVEMRMEEEEIPYKVFNGSSYCRAFCAGLRFELFGHFQDDGPFVLTSVQHSGTQSPTYISDAQVNAPYHNSFTSIPHEYPFRPPRVSLKPVMQGPQTAVVVGPEGEEINVDKYGRVKVKFRWDRDPEVNENASCWIRVAQIWSGLKWGAVFTPRIGHEVIVDFFEGDPDQPIIVGSVYNADNMQHYDLPKFKTISGVKSNSYPGGKGFCEIRIEDRKDKEQVFIHSQKRMDVRVRDSVYETCGGTRQICIGGNLAITVGGNTDLHIKKAQYEGIDDKHNRAVKSEVVYDFQNSHATLVKTKSELNAQQIIIEAVQKISLKVGGNFILIDPSGVTINGTMVKINSGGWGTETGDPVIDDPLDCEGADTGEPGYLDRPRRGGARTRNRRRLRSQHYIAPPRPGEDPRMTAIRNTLQHSAAGRHALEVYDRYGVTSSFNTGVGGGYSGNNMNLDPAWGDFNNSAFVHEMNHAQNDHEGTSADITNQSRADYVDTMMREEARGNALGIQAADELNDAGFPQSSTYDRRSYDPGYAQGVADARAANPNATPEELDAAGRQAGEQRVLDDYRSGRIRPSDIGGVRQPPYPDYYGQAWDGAHPAPSGGTPGTGTGGTP